MNSEEIDKIIKKCEIIGKWFNANSDGDYPASTSNILILIRDLERLEEIDKIIKECEIIGKWFNANSDGDYPASTPNILILIRDLERLEDIKEK